MKILITTVFIFAFCSGALAQGYRGEIVGSFVSGSSGSAGSYSPPGDYVPPTDPGEPVPGEPPVESFSSTEDYDGWSIGGRIYLDTVETNFGPFALAPYLRRADHIGLNYTTIETDSGAKSNEWISDTRFVFSDLVLEASYGQSENDANSNSDADLWRAGVGFYVARNTMIRGAYENTDSQGNDDSKRYTFDITHVQTLSNGMTWSGNALVGLVDETNDDGTDIDLSFDWFFNDNMNIGTELSLNSRDELGDTFAYEVHGEYFLSDYVSLRLSYFNQDYDEADVKADALLFQVMYRR